MLTLLLSLLLAPDTALLGTHDFGDVAAGTVVTHAFVLENPTDGPMAILSVEAGCRLFIEEKPEMVPAHAHGIFKVALNTHDHDGPLSRGLNIEYAAGDDLKSVRFIVKGKVHPLLELSRVEEASTLRALSGDPLVQVIEARAWSGKVDRLVLTAIEGPLAAEVLPGSDPKRLSVKVSPASSLQVGDHDLILRLASNVPEYQSVEVPIRFSVLDPFQVEPASLVFKTLPLFHGVVFPQPCQAYSDAAFQVPASAPAQGAAWYLLEETPDGRAFIGSPDLRVWVDASCIRRRPPDPAKCSKTIYLREARHKPFRVLSASGDNPALSVFARTDGPGRVAIVVTLLEDLVEKTRTTVTIQTDYPGREIITVPVTIDPE